LERVRCSYRLYVYGYVIMPEHVHLLLSEPTGKTGGPFNPAVGLSENTGGPLKPDFGLSGNTGNVGWLPISHPYTLADALKALKQGVSRRSIDTADHFWQKRYYDFNIRNDSQFLEKLGYIHRNPVRQGLCEHPEDWQWSSFRHHATGAAGRVEIESEWTARKRERAAGRLCPAVELPHSSQTRA
jgi:putative transposase